jgi:hypothetical protein
MLYSRYRKDFYATQQPSRSKSSLLQIGCGSGKGEPFERLESLSLGGCTGKNVHQERAELNDFENLNQYSKPLLLCPV